MPSALVTGGSSGIGLAIARMLCDEGFDLTLASRTREKIEAAAAELGAQAVTADTSMAAWSGIPGDEMIQPEDCAEVVRMCLRLSPHARIPSAVIERVGAEEGVG